MAKKTIWMNEPLTRLNDSLEKVGGRGGKFSSRLGDVVERYDLIIRLTPVPHLSDTEKMILGEVICGSALSAASIKWMHDSVLDCASGTQEEQHELSRKIVALTAAERIALIESLGL